MAAFEYCLLLLFMFVSLHGVNCDLNLNEGDACAVYGVNGTCVDVTKCSTAAITYLFMEAGYGNYSCPSHDCFPEMTICSSKGERPIVCCTDCNAGTELYRNYVIGPLGTLLQKEKSLAWAKCYDYFKRLPYPCRGQANVHIKKIWNEENQCYTHTVNSALAVGGRDAERWEFPHMALLGYGEDRSNAEWLCGGTIISEKFIMTAAHCTSTGLLGNVSFAALGLLRRTDPDENWKVYKIKRIIVHPEYKSPSKYHDIALLETDTEINFGKDLLPACLDIKDKRIFNTAEASGWGRLGHKKELANTLQVVTLQEFTAEECAQIYQPHRHLKHGYDHDKQMCYGWYSQRIVDTCQGDSGGPLQINQHKCLYTVVGVTSFGKDCGTPGSAGMYTRVKYYVPWIESIVWPGETYDYTPFVETRTENNGTEERTSTFKPRQYAPESS